MAILALSPEHNATEIQDIQALLTIERAWKSYFSPSKAYLAGKGMVWLDLANSAFRNIWYQMQSCLGLYLPGA